MDGLWCQCGEGIVDLRDLDRITEAMEVAHPLA